jgi:hypothetical protein
MSKKSKELLKRVTTWPDEDLEKLEEAARQIEAWRSGLHEASEEELRAIDGAIAERDRGQLATAEEVEIAFGRFGKNRASPG